MSKRSLAIVNKFFPDVTKVKDASKDLTIEVTKSDTTSSAVKNHKACAAAVACKRQMHLDGVIISRAIAYLVKDNTATRYEVPGALTREVVAFDRGGVFEPGEYSLQKPFAGIALGVKRAYRNKKKRPGNGNVVPRHVTTNIRTMLGGKKEKS